MTELKIEARKENMHRINEFVEEQLDGMQCSMRDRMQILLSVEEMCVNVINYAYGERTGDLILRIGKLEDNSGVSFTLIDSGIAFNPLEKKDPDVTVLAEERSVGGLGIFLTKQIMDRVSYQREQGRNILTMIRYFHGH